MTTADPSFQFCAHDSPVPHRPRKRSPHDQSKVTLQEFSSLRLRLRVAVGSSEPCRLANRSPSSSHGWSREGGGPPSGHQGSHLGVIASLEKAGRQGRRGSPHHVAGVRVALARISRHRDRVAAQKVKGNKRDASMGIAISLRDTILRVSNCVPKVSCSRGFSAWTSTWSTGHCTPKKDHVVVILSYPLHLAAALSAAPPGLVAVTAMYRQCSWNR